MAESLDSLVVASLLALALAFAPGCPRGILPLETNSIGPAAAVALAKESAKARPLVVAAISAPGDRDRGPIARRQCGKTAWQRTVVVYIRLRAYAPSASLSSRVDFVGRFKGGYKVWQVVH
jgi:hypothetical protein